MFRNAWARQGLVGVRHVHAMLEEPGREVLAGLSVPRDAERGLGGLVPDVWRDAGALPRARLHLVVGEHAEGRNHVLGEVLVLVVAPDDHHVRAEVVEDAPGLPEVLDQRLAVARRAGGARVGAVLGLHRGRPARGIAVARREAGVLLHAAQDRGHVLVQAGERRVVRHAQPENLAHEGALHVGCQRLRNPSPRGRGLSIYATGSATAPRSRRW